MSARSFCDRLGTVAHKLRSTYDRFAILGGTVAASALSYTLQLPPRDALPEPFDITNHIANAIDSAPVGVIAGYATLRAVERLKPAASPRQKRAAMITGALALGAAVNSVFELKFGHSLISHEAVEAIFNNDVRDPIDLAYGTIGAAAASYTISANISPTLQLAEAPLPEANHA